MMAGELQSTVIAEFHWLVGNQSATTLLRWYSETEQPLTVGIDIALAMYEQVWQPIQDNLANDLELLEIIAHYSDFTIGTQPSYTRIVNEFGTGAAGDALPPFCTLNLMKVPDQASLSPPTNDPILRGFVGFPGIPEFGQNNGLLSPAYITAWEINAGEILVVDVLEDAVPFSYTMGIYRDSAIVADRTYVTLSNLVVNQKIGTRNSRKR